MLDLLRKSDLLELATSMQTLLAEAVGFAASRQPHSNGSPPPVAVGWTGQAEHLAGGPVQRALCIEQAQRDEARRRASLPPATRDMFPE